MADCCGVLITFVNYVELPQYLAHSSSPLLVEEVQCRRMHPISTSRRLLRGI
ncbi:hypothetical protein BDV36DRAFT_251617 [Aspergillus pseudocaelatus]|uniref:Uncharacterized protein n=1 Tax=Aspergillus pseudocaelatus TaxID=1825620 RepID=A0ABQ6WS56_9EURO|nr:hypothetical protein BDV36DRAFT_251617 [Aspergillus pseudocaelatus]